MIYISWKNIYHYYLEVFKEIVSLQFRWKILYEKIIGTDFIQYLLH